MFGSYTGRQNLPVHEIIVVKGYAAPLSQRTSFSLQVKALVEFVFFTVQEAF